MLPIKQKLAIFRQLSLTLQIPVLESAKSIEKKIDTVRLGHACSLQSSQDSDFRKRPKKRRLRIMSSSEEEGQAKKPCTASLEQSCIESKPSSNSLEVSCIDQSNESVDVPCIESKPCIGESTNTERTKDVVTTSMSIPTTITPESNSKSDIQDSATDANINYFLKKYNGRYKQDDIQNEIERIAENLNMIAQLHHRIKLTSNEARPELEKLKKSICVKVSSSLLFITKQFPDEDLLRELTGLTMLKVFEKFRVRPFGVQYHQHRGKFQNCKILLLNCLRQGMFPKSAVVDYLTDPGLRHFCFRLIQKYENFTGQTTAETPHRSNSSDGTSKDGEKKTDDDNATLRKESIRCRKLIKKYENFTGQTTAETPHRSNSSDGASKDGEKKTHDDNATLRKESTVNDSAKDKTNKDDSTATAENTSQLLQATGEGSIAPLSSKDAVNSADSEPLYPDTGSLSPSGGGDPAAEIMMNLIVKLEGQSLMSNVSSDVAKDIMDDDDDDDDDGIEIISSVVRAPPSIPDGRVELPCVLSTGDEAKIKFCECLRNICSFKLKTRLYLPLSEQFFRILTCFFVLFNDRKVDGEIRYLLVKIFFVNLRRYLKAWMFSIHSAELNVFIKETFTPFAYITVEQLEALPDKQADLKPNETKLYRKLTEFVTDNLKRTGFRPCSESQYVVKLNSKEHVEMKQVALKVLGDYIKATHYDPFAANNNRVLANKNRQETSAIREVSLFQLITSIDIVLAFCNKSMKERLIRAHDARIVQFFEVRGIKIQCEKDLKLDGSIGINAKEATMEPLAKYLATRLNPMSKEAIRRETSLNKPSTSMPELIPLHGMSSPRGISPTPAGPSPPRTSVMRSPVTSHVYSTASSKQMISSSSGTPRLVTSPSAGRSMPDLTLDSPRATAPSSSNSIASTSANTVASASSNPVSSANTANPRLMVVRPLHPAPTTSDPSSKTPQIGSIVRVPSDLLKKYQTSQLYSNIIKIRRDVTPTSNSYQFLPAQVHTSTTRNPPSYNFPHPSNTSVLDSAFSNPSNSSSNNSASALTNPSNSNLPSNYVLVSAPTNPSNSNPPSNYVLNSALPTTPSNSSSTNYVANTKDPPAYCIVGPAQSNTYSLNNTMVSQSSASQSNYSSTSTSQPPNISQSSSSYSWPRSSPNFIWLPAGGDFEPHRINQPAEPRQKGPVRRGTGKRGGGGNRGKRGRGRGGIRLVDPSRLLGVSALRTPGTPAYTGDSNPFVPTTATQALRALRPALPQQSGQNTDNQYSSRNYEDPNVNHDPRGNYQAPGGNYQAPDGSYQNPNGSYQDPSSSYQDPSSSYQDPSGNYHDPASYENFNFNSLATGMVDNGLEHIRIENVLGGTCMSDQSDNAPSSELAIDTLAALESNYQPENFCAACGAQASMQCSGCYRIFYCSDGCQLNHWQIIHHEECVPSC